MQKQHNHQLFSSASCLIRVLHDELVSLSSKDLERVDVILPTQRLVLMLHAAMAKSRQAFIPGQWLTLKEFLKKQCLDNDILLPFVADELNVEMTLQKILLLGTEKKRYQILRVGHEKAVLQFFKELGRDRRHIDVIGEMRTVLQRDVFRSETQITAQHEKLRELEILWHEVIAWYKIQDRTPFYLGEAETAQNVLDFWGDTYQHPNLLKVVGLASVADFELPVLTQLAKTSDFYLHALPEVIDTKASPSTAIFHAIGGTLKPPILRSDEPRSKGFVYAASTVFDEIEKAIERVLELTKAGLPASQIAILIPEENTYEPVFREWLANQGDVKANLALSHRLKQTERGRWLMSLAECLVQRQDALALAGFALHTITVQYLAAKSNISFERMNSLLTPVFCSEKNRGDLTELIAKQRDPDVKTALLALQDTLRAHYPDRLLQLDDHMKELQKTCEFYRVFDEKYLTDKGLEVAFDRYFDELKLTMQSAAASLGKLPNDRFWRSLLSGLSTDLRSTGQPLQGLQILTLSEARHVPFQALVILGCVEGQFPKYVASEALVDDFLKQQVALPSWQTFDAMEEMTFDLFDKQIPSIDLLYVAGSEHLNQPSRFIDRVMSRKSHVLLPPLAGKSVAETIQNPQKSSPKLSPASVSHLLSTISASRLENFVGCPLKFLYEQLKVRNIDLPTKYERLDIGNLLHKVLELFFAGSKAYGFQPLDSSDSVSKAAIVTRLNQLTEKIFVGQNAEAELQLIWHSWDKFADLMSRILENRRFDFHAEKNIGKENLTYTSNGQSIHLSGRIDQVLSFDEAFLVIDYKSGTAPKAADLSKGYKLQPIYYLWALAQLDAKRYVSSKGIIGYWEILPGKWQGRSVGADSKAFADSLKLIGRPPKNEDLIQNMMSLWQWRLKQVLDSKEFAADATDCKHCHYKPICRRNDARYQKYFESSKLLQNRVGGIAEDE